MRTDIFPPVSNKINCGIKTYCGHKIALRVDFIYYRGKPINRSQDGLYQHVHTSPVIDREKILFEFDSYLLGKNQHTVSTHTYSLVKKSIDSTSFPIAIK